MYINDNQQEVSHVFKTMYRGLEYDPACDGDLIDYKVSDVTEKPKYKICMECKSNGKA